MKFSRAREICQKKSFKRLRNDREKIDMICGKFTFEEMMGLLQNKVVEDLGQTEEQIEGREVVRDLTERVEALSRVLGKENHDLRNKNYRLRDR